MACKHFRGYGQAPGPLGTCDAFPEGIPGGIIGAGEPHFLPVPGDNGVQFEMEPGQEAALEMWAAWEQVASGAG